MKTTNLYSFFIGNGQWWIILIVILVVLVILMLLPSKFIKRKKDQGNNNDNKLIEFNSDGYIQRASKFEINKPNQKKETKLLGIYNGSGHKTSMRIKSLVYVYPELDSCELCRPFEGKIISIDEFDNQYITMSEAISKGYHHVGCKHLDVDYYPNETEIPVSPWKPKEQEVFHKKVLQLFKLEQELRLLTFNMENKDTPMTEEDQKQMEACKQKIFVYCEKNNLTYSERRFSPNQKEAENFKYLPIESREK